MQSVLSRKDNDCARQIELIKLGLPIGLPFEDQYNFVVTSYFGDRVFNHDTQYHKGLDIITKPRNPFAYIIAVDAGEIIDIGIDPIYGKWILIEHESGYQTFYAHLSKIYWQDIENQKTVGCYVEKGTRIGVMGSTGISTGNHLHYEVRYHNQSINPLPLISVRSENEF